MAGEVNPSRQRNLLIVLVLLVAALGYTYRDAFMPSSVGKRAESGSLEDLDARLQTLQGLPAIELDRPLSLQGYEPKRDLFDFTTSPEALAAERENRRRQAEQQKQRQEQLAKNAEKRQEALARQAEREPVKRDPPPPRFEYTYRASIIEQAGAERILAALSKRGGGNKDIQLLVEEGETIDEEFVVKDITEDAVTIAYTDPRFKGKSTTVKLIASKDSGSRGRR
jgi:hypothetical protein